MRASAPTEAVLTRLIGEKLDRHNAIHATACILVNHMRDLVQGDGDAVNNDDYYAALGKLTAQKWLRGEFSNG